MRAKRKPFEWFQGLKLEIQGKNLALTVFYVPHLLIIMYFGWSGSSFRSGVSDLGCAGPQICTIYPKTETLNLTGKAAHATVCRAGGCLTGHAEVPAGRQRGDGGETAKRQRGDSGETAERQRGDSEVPAGRQRCTRNPKPRTSTPKPQTLNEPRTLNP